MWVAILKHGIISPVWFKDENRQSFIVNTERYLVVLRKFWAALGQCRTITWDEQWFQQDGATPHTSSNTLVWLRQRFEDRLISRRCDIEWEPHSPSLNPPDFYLWGYLKDRVYKNNCQTVGDLNCWRQQLQPGSGRSSYRNVFVLLTILYATCKCACSAKGVIWNIFWIEHKSWTTWPTNWKLCGLILHKLKIMCTKYEVIDQKHVEIISILVGGMGGGGGGGVTLYLRLRGRCVSLHRLSFCCARMWTWRWWWLGYKC